MVRTSLEIDPQGPRNVLSCEFWHELGGVRERSIQATSIYTSVDTIKIRWGRRAMSFRG